MSSESIKCVVIDDEPLAREGMELNIQDVSFLELVGQFSHAMAANDFLQTTNVDLMFCDIQMPGITGLDFIKNQKNAPLAILATAYPEYALEGFELDVIDYLVKPIRMQRFMKAANKAKEIIDIQRKITTQLSKNEPHLDYFYIKSERTFIRLFFKDIFYISGMKDYVLIHTTERRIPTALNIKTILAQLPKEIFVRTSKSHIINTDYIESIDIDGLRVNGVDLPLGRTYRDDFINKYVKGNLISRK